MRKLAESPGCVLCQNVRRIFESSELFFGIVKGMEPSDKIIAARLVHTSLRLIHFARRMGSAKDFGLIAQIELNKTLSSKLMFEFLCVKWLKAV